MKSKLKTHTNIKRGGLVACALIGLLLSGFSGTVEAATYYLDAVNGDDEAVGGSLTPWKTFARAMPNWSGGGTLVIGGDTVKLRDGNYGTVTFTYNDPTIYAGYPTNWDTCITYTADTGHTPVIPYLDIQDDVARWLVFDNITFIAAEAATTTVVNVRNAYQLRFTNCTIEGWRVAHPDAVYDDVTGQGIYITSSAETGMDGIMIDSCTISGVNTGIGCSAYIGDDFDITNNTIYYVTRSNISLPISNASVGEVTITGNHLYNQDSLHTGIDWSHGSGISIYRNGHYIANNIIHSCGSTGGISTYGTNGGIASVTIENNLIYDTVNQYAVRIEDILDGGSILIRNNTIVGSYASGDPESVGRERYYFPLRLRGDDSDNITGSGVEIYNNIIAGAVDVDGTYGDLSSITEDYNYIWSVSTSGGWVTTWNGANTTILTDSAETTPSQFDESVFENPRYDRGDDTTRYPTNGGPHRVTMSTDDWQLMAGSPCINTGSDVAATTTDLLGTSRQGTSDIGALEKFVKYLLLLGS